jgi:hypothetical protein
VIRHSPSEMIAGIGLKKRKMNKSLSNTRLTPNFSLYEFIEGTAMPRPSLQMNWAAINAMSQVQQDSLLATYTKMAQLLQEVRNLINQNFRSKNNHREIGIVITSGYRCPKWEQQKGRGTNSRHSHSAVDFIAHNIVNDALYNEVMEYMHKHFDQKTQRSWWSWIIQSRCSTASCKSYTQKTPFQIHSY